jgi:hypothetical protein
MPSPNGTPTLTLTIARHEDYCPFCLAVRQGWRFAKEKGRDIKICPSGHKFNVGYYNREEQNK